MGFEDLQYFFYVFYRPIVFVVIGGVLVASMLLAILTVIKSLVFPDQ